MAVFRKQTTAWKVNGKTVPAGVPGAVRVTIKSKKWDGSVNGKHVPLCPDKQAAERMLRKLGTDANMASAGLGDPFAAHKRKTLAEHLADYAAHLDAKGDTADYIKLTVGRCRALFDGCGFRTTGCVEGASASEWLSALRRPAPLPVTIPTGVDAFTPAEAGAILRISLAGLRGAVKRHGLAATGYGKSRRLPRATIVALVERLGAGRGPQTVNHYVRAVGGFFRWLVKAKRHGANPLDTLGLLNTQTDVRHGRRELTAAELRGLLAATRASTRAFRGLTGDDRFHLYLLAATTGFRASALSNLTPADFDLGAMTVTLAARFNKSRKSKVQPLPTEVVDQLRTFLRGKSANAPVFAGGGTWARNKRWAEMIRGDLAAAGIAYAVEGPDGQEYADFHALRHSYLTLGGLCGIDLRTLQELAGHSKPELTARYSHRRIHDLSGAVRKLPNIIPGAGHESAPPEAAGADPICTPFARSPYSPSPSLSVQGQMAGVAKQQPEITEPPVSQGFRPLPACPDITSH